MHLPRQLPICSALEQLPPLVPPKGRVRTGGRSWLPSRPVMVVLVELLVILLVNLLVNVPGSRSCHCFGQRSKLGMAVVVD